MAIGSVYHAERRRGSLNAKKSVTNFCRVVTSALESAGKTAFLLRVKLLSRGSLIVVMKLKSPATSFQKAVIDAKSLAVQFLNVSILALEIAVTANKEECTSLAKPTAREDVSVFTSARSLAQRTALLALRNVRTDASTASAQKPV